MSENIEKKKGGPDKRGRGEEEEEGVIRTSHG